MLKRKVSPQSKLFPSQSKEAHTVIIHLAEIITIGVRNWEPNDVIQAFLFDRDSDIAQGLLLIHAQLMQVDSTTFLLCFKGFAHSSDDSSLKRWLLFFHRHARRLSIEKLL